MTRLGIALFTAVLLLTAAPGARAAQSSGLPSSVRSAADQALLTTVNPRALVGGAAVIIACLLLLLYSYRQQSRYILFWITGWALAAVSMFIEAAPYPSDRFSFFAFGLSQFLAILSALVFVLSADAYRQVPLKPRRVHTLLLLPVFIWFTMAPLALGLVSVFAPGHLLIAGALATAGAGHIRLRRETWLLGAVVVGTMMLALAAVNIWVALGVPDPDAVVGGRAVFVTLALYLVTALGMQLLTFEDMTYELRRKNYQLETAEAELRDMVTTDSLTGCRNRRYFDQIIHREVQRHRRYNIPLSLLFIDVNRFKVINDTLGHEAGDRVLQHVAAFIISNVREADYVFRWGGDEFLIVISCTEEEAIHKGAKLQAAFAASPEAAALPPGVGLSIGCAEVREDADDVHALVKLADERMYVAKKRTHRARRS
jgi:diguanylate cyclase (GGDEF)-like protein